MTSAQLTPSCTNVLVERSGNLFQFFYLAGKFENTLSYTVLREQPANCLSTHQAHPAIQTRLYAMQGRKVNSVIPTRVLHKLNQRYRHVSLNPQQIK